MKATDESWSLHAPLSLTDASTCRRGASCSHAIVVDVPRRFPLAALHVPVQYGNSVFLSFLSHLPFLPAFLHRHSVKDTARCGLR